MKFLKQIKHAFFFGGTVFIISLLQNLAVDFYGVAAAVASFLILAIHGGGQKHLELTNQSAAVKHLFGMIVNPGLAVICVSSFFYVVVGEMVWYFWLVGFFFALILFAVDATGLLNAVKKS
jgi:hypothetical protein